MDDKGTLDDEVSIVSSDVCYVFTNDNRIINLVIRHLDQVTPMNLQIRHLENQQTTSGTPSKFIYFVVFYDEII